jgi:hypothetical protein
MPSGRISTGAPLPRPRLELVALPGAEPAAEELGYAAVAAERVVVVEHRHFPDDVLVEELERVLVLGKAAGDLGDDVHCRSHAVESNCRNGCAAR